MENIKRVDINEIEYIEPTCYRCGDELYALNGVPFTGIIFENFKGKYFEFGVKDGVHNGSFFSIHENGQKAEEGFCENGIEIEKTEWDKNGNMTFQLSNGFLRRWSPEGILLLERDDAKSTCKDFYATGELKVLSNLKQCFSVPENGVFIVLQPNIYTATKEQYFAKNEDLLLTRYSQGNSSATIHKYNWWFSFENSSLKKHFNDICNSEIADFNKHFINISAWIRFLLDTDKLCGTSFLVKMLEHSNLAIKYAALLIARDLKVKQVIPVIKSLLNINEYPQPEKNVDGTGNLSYGCTISQLAKDALRTIRNPFAKTRN